MRDRLSVVLRVRRAQERLAQARAGQAELAVRAAEREHADRVAEHASRPGPVGDVSPLTLQALRLQGLASYDAVRAAAGNEERTGADRDTALADSAMASVRRKGAERMVERRHAVTAAIAASTAQRALDELAVARWRNR